ncbi:epoxide hydrolase [Mucilaginibacter sp. HC2]|uniref:epoxide hydrolase family protein n=1 Tax=Mucilaginibacter inviolabilis TaxID=2714892 RepID=UPI0014095EED|nr:epoxide hydrolase family protein [Mucilaginibacter inviolabilis]NHA04891.1 epoxide hydrolase [Mucilaginibacter inviolabilis]
MNLQSFKIHITEQQLNDLQTRLDNIIWPDEQDNADWRYGVNINYLKELVDYWRTDYSWRLAEKNINSYQQYKIELQGVPVHFLHIKSGGKNPIPLILTHGWPWTFWDMHKIIEPLVRPETFGASSEDNFDLVIPSIPGYGFSFPSVGGQNFWTTADLWQELMTTVLGYEKYAASGGDWGALITSQLGHKYADSLYGIHLMHTMELNQFNIEKPWDVTAGHKTADNMPPEIRQQSLDRMKIFVSHYAVHILDPQTLAYGLQDSPVGLLAWLLERWVAWGDRNNAPHTSPFSKADMITNAMLYWATGTVGSSLRYYADAVKYPWQASHQRSPIIEAPTAITFLGGENPIGVTTKQRVNAFKQGPKAKLYNLAYLNAHDKGGHYGYYENPEAVIHDIREMFRRFR